MIKHLWKVKTRLAIAGVDTIEDEVYVVTGSTFCATPLDEMRKYSEATYRPSPNDAALPPMNLAALVPTVMRMDPEYVGEVWVEE